MALVTGYAVYFSGGRSDASPGDGVSGGSLILDFDPSFATLKSRGLVSFPELGKRDGGFFALEGVSYFVPDDSTGLPIDYEGRVLAVTCEEGTEVAVADDQAPKVNVPQAAKAPEPSTQKPSPKIGAAQRPSKPDPAKNLFFDLPDETDHFDAFQAIPETEKKPCDSPDLSLSASLRSAFQEPLGDEAPTQDAAIDDVDPPAPIQQCPSAAPSPVQKEAEIEAYFAPQGRELAHPAPSEMESSDDDDWAVYLAPQPTIQSHRPVPQVIEIITEIREPAQQPELFDPAIDLVLSGEEKQTFSLMAQDVVETVESFESLDNDDAKVEETPRLIAELRKLDPATADKRPRTFLPWIKRDETEEEMVERLTIKSRRHVG